MSDTPTYRWYRYYPQEEIDLGTMPFEGDWTADDRIVQVDGWTGTMKSWYYSPNNNAFGRTVSVKINGRIRQQWQSGVKIAPKTITNPDDPEDVRVCPVWFGYAGDGLCVVKLPEGETIEPVET